MSENSKQKRGVSMRVPKIAINGFGRIGRTITRLAKLRGHFDIVAINDIAPPEALLYAFRYDSIHGRYPGSAEIYGDTMNIDGDPFLILSERTWTTSSRAPAPSASCHSSSNTSPPARDGSS
jgi:hypothetical protein